MSRRSSLDVQYLSSSRRCENPRTPVPRGTIVTLCTGPRRGRSLFRRAWPDSWYAMRCRSSSLMYIPLRASPVSTRSSASSKSSSSMRSLFRRAARSAASLHRFSRSAPTNPGVRRARMERSTSGESFLSRIWTLRIASLPCRSGVGTAILRSNRPGRSRARSRTSGRFVAARTITPAFRSNPSISERSWFSVCSRSSCPPPKPAPRLRPTASISSMNTMHGALAFAFWNMSRTRAAPTPTNISTKSDPEMEKNGTPASPAIARARRVFPVPGGPTRRIPLGIFAPRRTNRPGSRR